MFEVLTLKSLGLEVTGLKKWPDIGEHVDLIVISYKNNSIYDRNVSTINNFLMFEVVTLKSLGLEVTGMRKWLDIVEHVVPIVISYKNNSISERNVSTIYNFLVWGSDLEKPWFGGHRYEEVTWYCWTCCPYSHIIQKYKYLWEKCFEILQLTYVWGSDLEKLWFGGHRYEKVTKYCRTCSPYNHIIQNEQYH